MLKLASLRALILSAVPSLAEDQHRLMIWAPKGTIAATGTDGLGFAYRYTINVLVTGFNQHLDSLIVPVLAWHKTHAPAVYHDPRSQDQAIEFEASIADPATGDGLDIWLGLAIVEPVRVLQSPDTPAQYRVHHFQEGDAAPAPAKPERWEVWLESPEGDAVQIGGWDGPNGEPATTARRTIDAMLAR